MVVQAVNFTSYPPEKENTVLGEQDKRGEEVRRERKRKEEKRREEKKLGTSL